MKVLSALAALLVLVLLVPTPVLSAPPPTLLPPPVAPEPYPFSDRYPVLIAVPDRPAMMALYALNLDVGNVEPAPDGSLLVTAYINPAEAIALASAAYAYVPIPNLGYRNFLEYGPGSIAPSRWPTYEELTARMQALESAHPAIVDLAVIGASLQGRPLYCLQISDNPGLAENEPEFRYVSTIHGDETTGIEMTLRLAEQLAANYGAQPVETALVNELEIWICPIYNPDGYVAGSRYNANGVDLNRDYPDRFTNPADDPTGREPETQAFMAFGSQHRFVMGANYHGGALVLNYPWDAVAAPDEEIIPAYAPDDELFHQFGYGYTSLNPELFESKTFDDGLTVGWEWYQLYGGLQDWAYLYRGEHHVTIEVSTVGNPAFTRMDDYWNANRDGMLWWMSQAVTGMRGRVLDARNKAPLDATVSVEGMPAPNFARTDPAVGDFHRVILPGDYTLTASAEGYLSQSAPLTVHTGAAATQTFYLCPSAPVTLQGTVVEIGSGLPLAATVELLGAPVTAVTDPASGGYTAQVCPGEYTLRVSAPEHYPWERRVSILTDNRQDFSLFSTLGPQPQIFWMPIVYR